MDQIQKYTELYKVSFENAPIGIALIALDGSWIEVNEQICKLTGYSKAELLQKTFQDVSYPEDLKQDLLFVKECIAGKIDGYEMEKRYVTKKGTLVWANLNVSLVREKGKPIFFISHIENIDAQKKAQQKLSDANDELERVNRMMVDRELMMIKLKEEIKQLKAQ